MCSTGSRASEKTLVLRESEQKGDQCLLHFSLYPPSFPLVELVLVTAQEQSEICPDLAMQSCWELSCPLIATCYSNLLLVFHHFCKYFWERRKSKMQLCHPFYRISYFNSDCVRTVVIKDSSRRRIYVTALYFSFFILQATCFCSNVSYLSFSF